jgi:hypothetical protein
MSRALTIQPKTMVGILFALAASASACGAAPDEGGGQAGGSAGDIATQPDSQPPGENTTTAPDAGSGGNCTSGEPGCGAGGEISTGGSATTPMPIFRGAQCTSNAPMSGTCGSAGDQCTYVSETVTHYCTCLRSAPASPGFQGWSCR